MYELTDAERAEVRAEFLEEQRKQAKAAYRRKLEQPAPNTAAEVEKALDVLEQAAKGGSIINTQLVWSGDVDKALLAVRQALAQQPAACRCVDCGGDQPGHDPHCAYMRDLHGFQPAAVDEAVIEAARAMFDSSNTWPMAAKLEQLRRALAAQPGGSDNDR